MRAYPTVIHIIFAVLQIFHQHLVMLYQFIVPIIFEHIIQGCDAGEDAAPDW